MFNLFTSKKEQLEDDYLYEQLNTMRGYLHEVENSDAYDPYRKEDLVAELTVDIINLEEYIMERHHERDIKPFKYTFYAFVIIILMVIATAFIHSLINS